MAPAAARPRRRSRLEPVADAPGRGDPAGGVGVALELLAEAADVDGDGGRVLVLGRRVPHLLESSWRRVKTCRGDRARATSRSNSLGRSSTARPSTVTSAGPPVDAQGAEVERPVGRGVGRSTAAVAAQHGAHPGGAAPAARTAW